MIFSTGFDLPNASRLSRSEHLGAAEPALVRIIDDDQSMRDALVDLFQSVGREAVAFASVQDFIEANGHARPGCLLLDVRLPGKNGLELQAELKTLAITLPVIIVTGHGDIRMSVQAMKAGAIDFFTKPFREQELLDAVDQAIATDRAQRAADAERETARALFASLTERERQVMRLVTAGQRNKQVAGVLGLSEVTIKIHRGSAMRTMNVSTLAELVRVSHFLEQVG